MTSLLEDSASADAVLRRVLDASLRDAGTRALPDLLGDLARSLAQIMDCGYVAISVGAPDGRLECLATAGDEATATRLFGGALAADDPLSDVTAEAVTVVLPDAARRESPHPSMSVAPMPEVAQLGVPILLRGRSAGGIFLGAPRDHGIFTEADVQLVQRVAVGAATVIEQARTTAANRRREAWYEVGAVLAREIVEGQHAPLQRIVDRVQQISEAAVAVIVQVADVPDAVTIAAAAGTDAERFTGTTFRVPQATLRAVVSSARPVSIEHVVDTALPRLWRERLGVDALLAVPLSGSSVQRGLLVMARAAGVPAYSPAESGMAMLFANTVALALELSESQSLRDQVALISERGRIARDLHDHVIQRLYALGLAMQSISLDAAPELGDRLSGGIDEIDETIKQIRSTIFRLTTPILSTESSLRARVGHLLDELHPVLGFRVSLRSEGAVDFAGDEFVVDDCIAVLREALTNVARHAHASRAGVVLRLTRNELQLEVGDDGRGIGDTDRRSGLANMRSRAEARGGSLEWVSAPGAGTMLHWTVPLDGDSDAATLSS